MDRPHPAGPVNLWTRRRPAGVQGFVLTLAQNTILSRLQNAQPDPLPEPGGLARHLLEEPWSLAIGLVVVALAAHFILRSRGMGRAGLLCAGVGVLLAAAVVALASMVQTPREMLLADTRRLVEAAYAADEATVAALLDTDVRLQVLQRASDRNRTYMLEQVRSRLPERYHVSSIDIRGVRAAVNSAGAGQSQISVTAQTTLGPIPTVWLLSWRQSRPDAPWKVYHIQAQQIGLNSVAPTDF